MKSLKTMVIEQGDIMLLCSYQNDPALISEQAIR